MPNPVHRQLKDALRACTAGGDWASHLPWVLLGLRVAPKEDSNMSSAELVYGAPLVTPGQISGAPEPPPAVFQEDIRAAPTHISSRHAAPPQPPEVIPPLWWIHPSSMFVVAALSRRYRPPTAGPLPSFLVFPSILFWTWVIDRSPSVSTA